jgi:type I restriction enzyme M protein
MSQKNFRPAIIPLHENRRRTKQKSARRPSFRRCPRDLEAQASVIDAAVFDLKAFNPSTVAKFDDRSPAEIIRRIHDHGRIVAEALARLAALIISPTVG